MSFLFTHIFNLYWQQLTLNLQRAIKVNYLLQCFYRPPDHEIARKLFLQMISGQPIMNVYKEFFVDRSGSHSSIKQAEKLADYFAFADFLSEISSCSRFRILNLAQLDIDDNMWQKVEKIVSNIQSLDTLILRSNRLVDIQFVDLPPNLKIIDLRKNPLQSVKFTKEEQQLHIIVDDEKILSGTGYNCGLKLLFDVVNLLF